MKLLTIVGARPNFIKASIVSHNLPKHIREVILHTGQHSQEMSDSFFRELNIPSPYKNLGAKTYEEMFDKIDKELFFEHPDACLVYGDTDSSCAGAMAAKHNKIPIYHVEAGLRSFNKNMREEKNRILIDHVSDKLFCPTTIAVDNLKAEGIESGVYLTGDVQADLIQKYSRALKRPFKHNYILLTLHRQETVDVKENLELILGTLAHSFTPIYFPMHPRCKKRIAEFGLCIPSIIHPLVPSPYLYFLSLVKFAMKVFTDSGGLQKEAALLGVPCYTLRNETEWLETLGEYNTLVGYDEDKILRSLAKREYALAPCDFYGENVGKEIARLL